MHFMTLQVIFESAIAALIGIAAYLALIFNFVHIISKQNELL